MNERITLTSSESVAGKASLIIVKEEEEDEDEEGEGEEKEADLERCPRNKQGVKLATSKYDQNDDSTADETRPRRPKNSHLSRSMKQRCKQTPSSNIKLIDDANSSPTKTTKPLAMEHRNCNRKFISDTEGMRSAKRILVSTAILLYLIISINRSNNDNEIDRSTHLKFILTAQASLIIGDSAIEIQEVDSGNQGPQQPAQPQPQQQQQQQQQQEQRQQAEQLSQVTAAIGDSLEQPSIVLGTASDVDPATNSIQTNLSNDNSNNSNRQQSLNRRPDNHINSIKQVAGPLPPIVAGKAEDITDGDKKSRANHDYEIKEDSIDRVKSAPGSGSSSPEQENEDEESSKAIAGKVVDFELTPAGGHNKAKIKKKKMKMKKKKMSEEKFKKWAKKQKAEKKKYDKKLKEGMKKKKEEGQKKKKKWGEDVHGQKKKGKFKKKKWGEKVKKGKGIKKGKKGKKFLKDKGHKITGFKTVYHKEEHGKSSKWHDIKREKKWDEKSKKWKKKWKKEKGKKYKGEHMKKFEKKKKSGKKYKKEKEEKFKKMKKEEFKKGKKMKKEEHAKKKEGGKKKEMKEMKKKKKKMKKKS